VPTANAIDNNQARSDIEICANIGMGVRLAPR